MEGPVTEKNSNFWKSFISPCSPPQKPPRNEVWAIFLKNEILLSLNLYIYGEFLKIQELTLAIIFPYKMENLKSLGIQPTLTHRKSAIY